MPQTPHLTVSGPHSLANSETMLAPFLPTIAAPESLAAVLGDARLLVVDLGDAATHARHHVPGAVHLDYEDIIRMVPPAMGLLPDSETLSALFSRIGLTPDRHVVAHDDERNSLATRLLWTLDAIGHTSFSLLDGGLRGWLDGGFPVETGTAAPAPSRYRAGGPTAARADKAYVLAHLNDPDVVLLDTRTPAEFAGADVRAARGGHIPGAVNMDWTLAIDPAREPWLKPEAELRRMLGERGVTPDKEVIVYCQTHHRSSHSYVLLKALGFARVRGYDGSWSEWGNDPDAPIES